MSKNPKAASICNRLTIGEKILIQNSHPRELPIVAQAFLSMSVFHTEKAICITNIPTDIHMILFLHFFVSSSSFDEKRRRITPTMRNMTAIAIKKFLIWNAIVVNVARTQSEPYVPAEKKNQRIGPVKLSRRSFEFSVDPIFDSRTLISFEVDQRPIVGAAETIPDVKKRAMKMRKIRINIEEK